jgi:hypothetical protein
VLKLAPVGRTQGHVDLNTSWGSPRLRLELLIAPVSSFFPFSLAVLGLHFSFVSLPLFSRMTREGKRERERARENRFKEREYSERAGPPVEDAPGQYPPLSPSVHSVCSLSLSLSLSSHSLPLRRRETLICICKERRQGASKEPLSSLSSSPFSPCLRH